MRGMKSSGKYLYALAIIAGILVTDSIFEGVVIPAHSLVSSAEARVVRQRPARTVAGVARRTTRRVIRRSTIYYATRPAGCVAVKVYGSSLLRCRGVYYQQSGGRYVVVYID